MSNKGSNSESSSSSPNQHNFFSLDNKDDITDLTLSRTGTVRRASSASRKDKDEEGKEDRIDKSSPEPIINLDRYRKSLDSTYRNSLESISEYKTKSTFSSTSLFPSIEYGSIDSSSSASEHADHAIRTSTDPNDKTILSPGSSYLTWIESVNSEYFASGVSSEVQDCDNKVGEWNNFWLNYSSARGKYMSSPYLSTCNDDKTGEDISEVKSTCSTQRDFTEKNSSEYITLTIDEINEAIRCSTRLTDILQGALKRNDREMEISNLSNVDDSYYSQPYSQPYSRQNSSKEMEVDIALARERSFSYVMDAQEYQRQKQLIKPTPQSSSTSCINALLNTGVADMFKKVIAKRKDVLSEDFPFSRSSFSEWTSSK